MTEPEPAALPALDRVKVTRQRLSGAIRRYYLKGLETGVVGVTITEPLTIDALERAIGEAQDAFEAAVARRATEAAAARIAALEAAARELVARDDAIRAEARTRLETQTLSPPQNCACGKRAVTFNSDMTGNWASVPRTYPVCADHAAPMFIAGADLTALRVALSRSEP